VRARGHRADHAGHPRAAQAEAGARSARPEVLAVSQQTQRYVDRRSMRSIETPRLRLVPISLVDAEAMLHGQTPAGRAFAPGYPTDRALIGASIVVAAAREGRKLGPWTTYMIVRREDGLEL